MPAEARLLTKLTAPTLPPLVPRSRLFRLLDRARGGRVLWVAAIPGSGKTTLVASYLRARRQASLWIQLDEGDRDPATFFHYLRLAADARRSRTRSPLERLTPEYLPQLGQFAQRFFDALYERLAPRTTIVLDNYQTLHADSPVHEIVRMAAQRLPHDVRLFVISRHGVPPSFAGLQAEQRIDLLPDSELRLTEPETKLLIRLHVRKRARREVAAVAGELHATTGGWLAATVLMLKHGGVGREAGGSRSTIAPEVLFDYFATEVLNDLELPVRNLLLATAVLPSMTAAMAQSLTGDSGAGRMLAGLQRTGYFTERRDEAPPRYQYHPLFRGFLLSRAVATLSAQELRELRGRAAELLAGDGQIEAAVALRCAARQFDHAVALIVASAPGLLHQGRASVVTEWIASVPQDVREREPWLSFWQAVAVLVVRPMDAQPLFERALSLFEKVGDRTGALLACAGVIDSIFLAWCDVPQLDRWGDRLNELVTRTERDLPPPIEASVACAMIQALFWRRPSDPAFMVWAKRAEHVLATAAELDVRVTSAAVTLTNAYMNLGEVGHAERVLASLEARFSRATPSPFARLAALQMHAVIATYVGDSPREADAVKRGLEFAAAHGLEFWNVPLLGTQCIAELTHGDVAAAQRTVARLLALPSDGVMVFRTWILALQSWVEHELGNVYAAHRAAEAALRSGLREGPFPEILARFSLAQTSHALGRASEAANELVELDRIARDTRCPIAEIGSRFMAAQFAFARGDTERGLAELEAGLRAAHRVGYLDWQCRIGRDALASMCAKAIDAGIEPDYVRAFVRHRGLLPPADAAHLEAWPWPVKIYCLGRFALARDGKPVKFSGKTQTRPLDLLKVAIALGGRDVGQSRIAELLWPEADGDAAIDAFNTNLKRLRALLGRADALTLAAGKLTVNPRVCWVDAWALERALRHGNEDAAATQRALALYRGAFLGTEEPSWSVPLRERLRARFMRGLSAAGGELERRGEWAQAADLYRQGIDADDVAENLYQRLMLCHEHLDQRDEALAVYRRCKKLLKSRLGVAPAPKTQKLYDRLVAG